MIDVVVDDDDDQGDNLVGWNEETRLPNQTQLPMAQQATEARTPKAESCQSAALASKSALDLFVSLSLSLPLPRHSFISLSSPIRLGSGANASIRFQCSSRAS